MTALPSLDRAAVLAKAEAFAALHAQGCFALVNVWDAGSARLMAASGAQALATSSAAQAYVEGLPDGGGICREDAIAHAAWLNAATPLPVSADLEDGFGPAPETVAETTRRAAEAGLAGGSIEDVFRDEGGARRAYGFDEAVARIAAAAQAARAAGRPFQLTARADGVLIGAYDVDEAIRRLQAFEAAGADVLYAPGPPDLAAQAEICRAVGKPVNALAAGALLQADMAALARAGARRVSLGSTLARRLQATMLDCVTALLENGDFAPLRGGAPSAGIDALLRDGARA